MYEYRALITKVVDGDTVRALVDLGLNVKIEITLRLYGINTPEMNTQEGRSVQQLLKSEIEGKEIIIQTIKDKKEKYGRYLAVLYDRSGQDLNKWLLDSGYAVEYLEK